MRLLSFRSCGIQKGVCANASKWMVVLHPKDPVEQTSDEAGKGVVQDLKQFFKSKQRNTQKTIIKGSKCVEVTTTDTQVALNLQILIQILVAIVAKLDIG